jgi:3-methylcrotonyl-CoA carboxylase alpha subunit
MGAAAVAAAKAVGYVGAGTVEFIAEPRGDGDVRFYFMEMNTRLQVEHPVTEAITGLDLVEWQLRVAAGEPLPMKQEELAIRGHAIEARICAENPETNFLPATGVLRTLRWPAHVAFRRNADAERLHEPAPVRVDAGVREGDAITPHYDSMIAKLIVWGETRAQALARLDAALADTHIVGLHTNVAFLRRAVRTKSFAGADLDTALIERERDALFKQPPLALEIAAAGVVAHALADEAALQNADPWSRRDGFRLHGGARRHFHLARGDDEHAVALARLHDGTLQLQVGEAAWPFAARSLGNDQHEIELGERRLRLAVYAHGEQVSVFAPEDRGDVREVDDIAHAGERAGGAGQLTAPMPGKLIAYMAKPGERVARGQALAVIEAMKMEHTIHAPHDGVVHEWLYAAGDQVAEGTELLRLQA